MRVLAVVYCYPPMLVPAAICYMKLMLGLREAGVEVEVVHIDPDTFVPPGFELVLDQELAAELPPDQRAHVIRSPECSPWLKLVKRIDASRRFSHRWLEPKKREWTVAALKQLRQLDLQSYDALLTCSQPHANHLVGLELQEETGLPWVAYFSDPWTDSPYIGYPSARVRAFNLEIEDRILARADRVLYTCDEMRRMVLSHHAALDEERSGCLAHAFVSEWYSRPSRTKLPESGARPRLLQTGSFYGPRTPRPLVEAMVRLRDRNGGRCPLQVDIYGGMGEEHRREIDAAGLSDDIRVHGLVGYLDTLALMRESSGLLLVDAPVEKAAESVFLPSKLIDYLGSGKAILAVTPDRGATARVVREVGGRVCALEHPDQLDRALDEFASGGGFDAPRADAVSAYAAPSVGRQLREVFESLL